MAGLSYPAARVVAKRLEARIAISKTAYKNGTDAPKPDAASVEEIITTAFWASLRREEGHSPRISIAFVPPEQSIRPLKFSPPVRLDATQLSRIAPAVEKPGIHIGVLEVDARGHEEAPDRREVVAAGRAVCRPRHALAPIRVLAAAEELPVAVPVMADVEDRRALDDFRAEEDQHVLVREVIGHRGNIHALRLTA